VAVKKLCQLQMDIKMMTSEMQCNRRTLLFCQYEPVMTLFVLWLKVMS